MIATPVRAVRPAGLARLPAAPGVYRFRDAHGRALYLGRAVDLRRRVGSYWGDLRGRTHLRTMVARIARIEAVQCDSEPEAAWLERNLLEHTLLPWNRTRGGQEVLTHLRLDTHPRSPGLRPVHQISGRRDETAATDTPAADSVHFGPYLGGDKVRLAVAALHRVLPLAYTGTGLSGSEREMASRRGAGPGDRDRFARTITAVLRRDPTAVATVRHDLLAHRDRAAEALDFERAARIQTEIHALDWITGPQRVTAAEPYDADVAGWADGVLVRFGIRAGRLCTWAQRQCGHTSARRHLTATPPGWTEFADRNAQLAARLWSAP